MFEKERSHVGKDRRDSEALIAYTQTKAIAFPLCVLLEWLAQLQGQVVGLNSAPLLPD